MYTDPHLMSDIHLDNSGAGPLQVPGFEDVPLDYELKIGQSFAHGALPNASYLEGRATRLTLPEVFMLRLMERVTEIPNWEEDVFDDDVRCPVACRSLVRFQVQRTVGPGLL